VDATSALSGPAGHVDVAFIFSETTSPTPTSAATSNDFNASTPDSPVLLAPSASAPAENDTATDYFTLHLKSGASTVTVQLWVRSAAASGAKPPSCHFSTSVTPLQ
jgi:hypothetical protein